MPTEPLHPADEALEARVRLKQARDQPLDDEERAFLARMPAHRELSPSEVQDLPDRERQ